MPRARVKSDETQQVVIDHERELRASSPTSLCDALDRVLDKGAVVSGQLTISVAGIDLVAVGLNALVSSIEALERSHRNAAHQVENTASTQIAESTTQGGDA